MKRVIRRSAQARDLREHGRVILAHGEVTGHHHEVLAADAPADTPALPPAEYFEEPDGRRILLVLQPCVVRHPEHAPIALDPETPRQVRQGDVFLLPLGRGAWQVIRQRQYFPAGIVNVAD